MLAIVLIGAFLRVYQLSAQSIWLDEAFSVRISQLPVLQMVLATAGDVHPPFYYFLLHYWIMVFGTSESAVRLLSVLFGVLSIPMIYIVGRQLFNKEAGLVAALILALSSFNIYYSQEARMYSLMVLLALLSMHFFWRFLQQSSLVSSVGYVLSTAFLVYTHDYGWFVVIAENIFVATLLLLSKHRTYKLRHWVALQAIVAALYVPWIVVLKSQFLARQANGTWLAPPTLTTIIDTFYTYSSTEVLLALFLGLSVLSLFAFQRVRGAMDWKAPLKVLESYVWEVSLQDPAPLYFLAVLLLAVNLIPFTISHFSAPIYLDKYAIVGSVALYLLVAKGISNISHKYTKLAVIGLIVILFVPNLQVYYTTTQKSLAREAAGLIYVNAKNGDVILVTPEYQDQVISYYNTRTDLAIKVLGLPLLSGNNTQAETDILQSDLSGYDRVWFVATQLPGSQPTEDFTLSFLNKSYAESYAQSFAIANISPLIDKSHSYNYNVYLYEKRA